jgi:tight adherence protein C
MTLLLSVLGIGLVGLTARLLIHAVLLPRLSLNAHLRRIDIYGFGTVATEDAEIDSRTKLNAAVGDLAERIGAWMIKRIPRLKPVPRGVLTAAGRYELSVEAMQGYRVLAAGSLTTMVLFLMFDGIGVSLISMLLLVGAVVGGWQLPAMSVRRRATERLFQIDRTLPDLIDVMIATMEAGMGIAGGLSMVADRFEGPLGDELRLMVRQQQLGVGTGEALADMADRCDTPSMRAFARTVSRGDQLGGSISPILRELAIDVRRRRRHAAREKIQKAPVKLMFPMMLLIFPALLVVLGFPVVYALIHSFSGG